MADEARVSHESVEVVLEPDDRSARSSHESVEVVIAPDPAEVHARSTEMFVEVFVGQPYTVIPTVITRTTSLRLAN